MVEEGGRGRNDRVGHRGQGLEVDVHPLRGVLGGRAAAGDNEGDGLSDVAHPVGGERELEEAEQPVVGDEANRNRPELLGELAGAEDRGDTGHGPCRRRLEGADPRVRHRAADHGGVEHAGHVHVVHVDALAPHPPGIFEATDRAADGGKHTGGGRNADPLARTPRGRRRLIHERTRNCRPVRMEITEAGSRQVGSA